MLILLTFSCRVRRRVARSVAAARQAWRVTPGPASDQEGEKGEKRETFASLVTSFESPPLSFLPLPVHLAMPCTYAEAICMMEPQPRPSQPAALWKCVRMCVFSQALAHRIPELMCTGRLPAGLELQQEPPEWRASLRTAVWEICPFFLRPGFGAHRSVCIFDSVRGFAGVGTPGWVETRSARWSAVVRTCTPTHMHTWLIRQEECFNQLRSMRHRWWLLRDALK